MIAFSLNQISAPELAWPDFVAAAKHLGCAGVELRNDLDAPMFDGDAPGDVRVALANSDMKLFALAQIGSFNDLDDTGFEQACTLIEQAHEAGTKSIALIPRVGGGQISLSQTADALGRLGEPLEAAGLIGLVEPVGFTTSTLRTKADALDAISMCDSKYGYGDQFAVIHDTFHHHISGEDQFFADRTGLIHVSGVTAAKAKDAMEDADRGLVDDHDVLGNITQLRQLIADGYDGPISVEAFSPDTQALNADRSAFMATFEFMRRELELSNSAAGSD